MRVLSFALDQIATHANASGALWRQYLYAEHLTAYHIVARTYRGADGEAAGWSDGAITVTPTHSRGRLGYLRDAVRLGSRVVRRSAVDVICSADPFLTGLAALAVGRRHGLPVEIGVMSHLWGNPHYRMSRLQRLVGEAVLRRADAIRVSTVIEKAQIEDRFDARVHVAPFFVDVEAFDAVAGAGSDGRRRLDLPGGARVVLSIGRLVRQKRFDHLLRAFASVAADDPRAVLAIAGDGPDRAALEAEAAGLGIADRVRFLGLVPNGEIPALLDAADLFVMASEHEGTCMVLLEAALRKVSVVSTAFAGARDLLEPLGSSLVSPVHDPDALARNMSRLLEDRSLREDVAERLNARVRERFDPTTLASRRARQWASLAGVLDSAEPA